MAAQSKYGLLRRFRLRLFSYGGHVAPRNDEKANFRRFCFTMRRFEVAA